MALNNIIKGAVAISYKSLRIYDLTGYGINGYGANQDPVSYREAASNGTDILAGRLLLTSPSGTVYTFAITPAIAFNLASGTQEYYEVLNTDLGLTVDEFIEDGIWKSEYIVFFANAGSVTISTIINSPVMSYNTADFLSFKNADYIYLNTTIVPLATAYLHGITTPVTKSSANIYTDKDAYATLPGTAQYRIGYAATKYFPVARSIKECLDNKVADLVECNCAKDDPELIHKYLLYDAMFINCEIDNVNKATQIFTLLSKYCDEHCGCN
jgi:hypothetical protein